MLDAGGTIAQVPMVDARADVAPFGYLNRECRMALEVGAGLDYAFAAGRRMSSSEYRASDWSLLAQQIYAAHGLYDGIVVAHGTATLSYAASLCSFMLADLRKSIVFTGAQIPVHRGSAALASDGFANLLAAVKVAAAGVIKEVTIVFGDQVLRGNRACKQSVAGWNPFRSPNYPALARIDASGISYVPCSDTCDPPLLDPIRRFRVEERIHLVPIHPALQAASMRPPGEYSAVIVTGYLAGIVPTPLRDGLRKLATEHLVVVCGQAELGAWSNMRAIGDDLVFATDELVWSQDMTLEATLMKTMWALAQESDRAAQRSLLLRNIAGELTVR
jgi:L-asparaginase/Glu-tRNA(Gln) amidotransferase subunit D